MRLFKQLKRRLHYLPEADIARIEQAFQVAYEAQLGQLRANGDPYITHPVAVACILADNHLDAASIMAALMHDVVEDTATTLQELENQFGEEVALLVDGVTKLTQITGVSRAEAKAANVSVLSDLANAK